MQAEVQVYEKCECRRQENEAERREKKERRGWLAVVLAALMLAALPTASAGLAALFAAGGVRTYAATVQTGDVFFSADALTLEGATYLCKDALLEGLPQELARQVQAIPGRFYGAAEFIPASPLETAGITLAE